MKEKIEQKIEELTREQQRIVINNMPKFERGIAEASLETEQQVWKDLLAVFQKHGISPSVKIGLRTANQKGQDPFKPDLAVVGVFVDVQYVVSPKDKAGVDGHTSEKDQQRIADLEAQKQALLMKLQGV